ncbi:MAG: hypothetical protein H6581_30760 [Bacteroidia bacterium]|nr:hypothetical protein [Bacteroidia bacterium]
MKPLIVLFASFLISGLAMWLMGYETDLQTAGSIAMAVMLSFTAVSHFVFVKGMAAMIPGFIPFKNALVYLTGGLEFVLAAGLLFPSLRFATGWATILFFLLILPANIQAAVDKVNLQTGANDGPGLSYLWFRIPLQVLFIAWVFLSAVMAG